MKNLASRMPNKYIQFAPVVTRLMHHVPPEKEGTLSSPSKRTLLAVIAYVAFANHAHAQTSSEMSLEQKINQVMAQHACDAQETYVKFYASFRTSGEPIEASRQRYSEIRALTPTTAKRFAGERQSDPKVTEAYVAAAVRGGKLADLWIELHDAGIEKLIADRRNGGLVVSAEDLSKQIAERAKKDCLAAFAGRSQDGAGSR